MLAELLALSLWGHHHAAVKTHRVRPIERHGRTHGWQWAVITDRFTGKVSCQLHIRGMHVRADTVIFELKPGAETIHAVVRIDSRPPQPVSDMFAEDQKHGIFPERGWIDDRRGGEVALPLSMIRGARVVWIRPKPKAPVYGYNVSRLDQALAALKHAGCPDGTL
jgi:hypothetical protein